MTSRPRPGEALAIAAEELLRECSLRGISPEALRGPGRSPRVTALRRDLACQFAFGLGLTQDAIAELLGRDRSQISRLLSPRGD